MRGKRAAKAHMTRREAVRARLLAQLIEQRTRAGSVRSLALEHPLLRLALQRVARRPAPRCGDRL
jgi:hypothetical protein